jgi:hypothetical protein
MPVLDAKALRTDPKGLAFLRDVLRREQAPQEAETAEGRRSPLRRSRAKSADLQPDQGRTV